MTAMSNPQGRLAQEIAARQRIEAALGESEEKYRNLFHQAADAIFVSDETGRIIDANRVACASTGYGLNELLNMALWELNPEEWSEEKVTGLFQRLRPGQSHTFESAHQRKDGSWFPVEVKVCCFEAGGRMLALDLVRDISARKEAETALRRARDELEERVAVRTAELSRANRDLRAALAQIEQLKNRIEAENIYLQEEIKLHHNFDQIISRSRIFRDVLGQVEQVAGTGTTVLISGETGTGKELVARAVHDLSDRQARPLVKVNCAALPANLIESELFGHEKGAFTGALTSRPGRFEVAHGGTIFLDEIGDLPVALQAKLLRVLQEGEFERLGSGDTRTVDVRVIAATNRVLEREVEAGNFREDLYYRLNVFPLQVPPLRQRVEDIPLLVSHFAAKYSRKIDRDIAVVPQRVMDALCAYHWPGNVRELENIIERAVIISRGNKLELGDWFKPRSAGTRAEDLPTLRENERALILKALAQTGWRVSGDKGAARRLDIHPQTLVSRMKKLGIRRDKIYEIS